MSLQNMDAPTMIGGIIVLAIIIFSIVAYAKTHPSQSDKDWAKNFLDGLSNNMYNEIINIINTTDFSQFKTVSEANEYVTKLIYSSLWNYVETELNAASSSGIVPALAAKVITRDTVEAFIKEIMKKMNFDDKLVTAYVSPSIEAEPKEDDYLKEFSDPKEYNLDEFDTNDLEKVSSDEPKVVDTDQEIIPPSDEEEVLKEDDDSIDQLTPEQQELVERGLTVREVLDGFHFDKNGRKRNKNGRYAK